MSDSLQFMKIQHTRKPWMSIADLKTTNIPILYLDNGVVIR